MHSPYFDIRHAGTADEITMRLGLYVDTVAIRVVQRTASISV